MGGRSAPGLPATRSCTSSAAIKVLDVEGSKTSTPNRCAPAKAAARARFLTTERVRVDGATWNETSRPAARSTHARQRWIRFASA